MEKVENNSKQVHQKIQVSESVFVEALRVFKELKGRSAQIKIEDLFQEAFEQLDEKYWNRQLEKFTPDEFLLEMATENPEAKQFLIQQARKALELMSRGEPILKDRKRPGPKPKSISKNDSDEVSHS